MRDRRRLANVDVPQHPLRLRRARVLLLAEQQGRFEPEGVPLGHRGLAAAELVGPLRHHGEPQPDLPKLSPGGTPGTEGTRLMQTRYRPAVLMLSCLALSMLLTGCPKRPVATVASVPAPAAPAPAPPPPPPAPPPAPAPAPPPAPTEYMPNPALKEIYFDFDKSNIRPGDAKILDASAAYLKANPNELVLIEGHCDERGTIEYNLALGERRAKAAMNYLVSQGIDASRFTLISYGKERPVCTEKTEACWAKNRFDRFLTKPK